VSTTGQGTTPVGATGADDTQKIRRPGTQTGQGTGMRDGAMARTAPRRDLNAAAARARGGAAPAAAAARSADPGSRGAAGAGAGSGGPGSGGPGGAGPGGSMARTSPARTSTARRAPSRPVRRTGPRLVLQRIDPWSVMKISFLVSVALGVATVIAVAVLWTVLNGMNVFSTVNDLIVEITTGESSASSFNLMDYVGFGRVVSLSVVIAVINVILLTALATLTAFLYNVCTALVGGAHLTLSDE